MQSEARSAKNVPESAIYGVLPNRPTPTGSMLWLVPISNPRSALRRVGRTNLPSDALRLWRSPRLADRARSDGHAPGELLADVDLWRATL